MFERYTELARRVVFHARYEASQFGSPYIELEHLLLGLLQPYVPVATRLGLTGFRVQAIRARIERERPAREKLPSSVDTPLSAASKQALKRAEGESKRLKQKIIGPEHLLLGIALEENSLAAELLRDNNVTVARLRDEAIYATANPPAPAKSGPGPEPETRPMQRLRDLTHAASQGEIGFLVGRDGELDRILQILARRTKNNPVLIGEAGIGKTAIVEGLARRISDGTVPPGLAERKLMALDASSLALPSARRQLDRFDDVLGAIAVPEQTILFVRGLFDLAAAGSAWAIVEAMRSIEPWLNQHRIQCIATGSPEGLRQTVEKAGALARHFEVVAVEPVTEADAVRILEGLKARFEAFHGVAFAEGALETAVKLSGRCLSERHLPDRAIDLIDEAAAAVKLRRWKQGSEAPPATVEREDVEAAATARAGTPKDAIAEALGEALPSETRALLARYLAACTPEEAEALAQAIRAAKRR